MPPERQAFPEVCDVAVVGGGPAGLALASALKRQGVRDVVVLEREQEAGGIPRHCGHYPFGMRELGRVLKGPDYARRLVQRAHDAGVVISTRTTVTALHPKGRLSIVSPDGICDVQAKRVALCTGVRESSRAQRFIGGDRPLGVISTGALQSMVYLEGLQPFRRPVILGTELVSFSALLTCRHGGIRPVAMIEENDRVTARLFATGLPRLINVPMFFGTKGLRILGRERVEGVQFLDGVGEIRTVEADGVIVTGRFRPESALLWGSHLETDPGTGGPVIDQDGRCSDSAYFAAGNLLRPVETAGWSFREGEAVAGMIARDFSEPERAQRMSLILRCAHPALRYAVPQRLTVSEEPGALTSLQLRLKYPADGYLAAETEGITLWRGGLKSRPERRILIPLNPLLDGLRAAPVDITLQEKR